MNAIYYDFIVNHYYHLKLELFIRLQSEGSSGQVHCVCVCVCVCVLEVQGTEYQGFWAMESGWVSVVTVLQRNRINGMCI